MYVKNAKVLNARLGRGMKLKMGYREKYTQTHICTQLKNDLSRIDDGGGP